MQIYQWTVTFTLEKSTNSLPTVPSPSEKSRTPATTVACLTLACLTLACLTLACLTLACLTLTCLPSSQRLSLRHPTTPMVLKLSNNSRHRKRKTSRSPRTIRGQKPTRKSTKTQARCTAHKSPALDALLVFGSLCRIRTWLLARHPSRRILGDARK